jgi:hypothetical protein
LEDGSRGRVLQVESKLFGARMRAVRFRVLAVTTAKPQGPHYANVIA